MPRIPPPIMSLLKIQLTHLVKDGEKDLATKISLAVWAIENGPELIKSSMSMLMEGDRKKVKRGEKPVSEQKPLSERIEEGLQTASNWAKIRLVENTVAALAKKSDELNELSFRMVTKPEGFQQIQVENPKLPKSDADTNEYWFRDSDRLIKDVESVKFFKVRLNEVVSKSQKKQTTLDSENKVAYDAYRVGVEKSNKKIKESNEKAKIYNEELPKKYEEYLKLDSTYALLKLYSDKVNELYEKRTKIKAGGNLDNIVINFLSPNINQYFLAHPIPPGRYFLETEEDLERDYKLINNKKNEVAKKGIHRDNTAYLNIYLDMASNLYAIWKVYQDGPQLVKDIPEIELKTYENFIKDNNKETSEMVYVDKETFLYNGPLEDSEKVNDYCKEMLKVCDPLDILIQLYHGIRRLILKIRIFIYMIYKQIIAILIRIKKTAIQIGEDCAEWISGTFQTVASVGVGSSVSIVTI